MKYVLKAPGIYMKSAMKYLLKLPGIYMKSTMKYPGAKNEISIESARYLYEKHNEIFWG